MEVRKDPKTGDWSITGLTTDQLFDICDAACEIGREKGALRTGRRDTCLALHVTIMEATDPQHLPEK